jgi:hypothetical protein
MRHPHARRTALALLAAGTLASCGGDAPTALVDPPSAPTGVQATAAANGAISVSWSPVAGASSYTIYMASQAGVTKDNYAGRPDGGRIAAASSPTVVTDLEAKTYYFVVTASNAGGESQGSAEVAGAPDLELHPLVDSSLPGGSYTFTSLTIPAGVTVRVTGPVAIAVTGDAAIDGTLTGDCESLEIRATGALTIDGLLTNACDSLLPTVGPDLTVVAGGGLTIGTSPSVLEAVVSDGSIRISDTATENESFTPLFDSEASPAVAPPGSSPPARQAGSTDIVVNRPVRAGRGQAVRQSGAGDVHINADITAMAGLDASPTSAAPTCDNGSATGPDGGSVFLSSRGGTLQIANGVTISAGNGGGGADCTAGSEGSDAEATGGTGGVGGSIFLGGQTIAFGTGVTLTRGNGGRGGDAVAVGSDGQAPCEDGYTATATGGRGGRAGGIGYVIASPSQVIGSPTETGAIGGRGGNATSEGGNGADCVCEATDTAGGGGGTATALGGTGGDGASGRIWPRSPTGHRKGSGGDAIARGGDGGNGADCCDDKQPGGDGENGGDAMATGGPQGAIGLGGEGHTGTAAGFGGDGGDGGDGLGGGSGGAGGSAMTVGTTTQEVGGEPGADGEWCPDLSSWFVSFGLIANGNLAPGTDILLPVFDEGLTTQTGTVPARFKTVAESGETGVQYFELNEFLLIGRGDVYIDLSSVVSGFPIATVSALVQLVCTPAHCAELVGYYHGAEVARVGSEEVTGTDNEYQYLRLPPPPDGVPYYDAMMFEAHDGGFWINDNTGLAIVDP